jgi:ribonucleotide reductase alpha subunit
MMLEASGGVEPFFALAYHYQGILGGNVNLHYVNKYLEAVLNERGLYSDQLIEKVIEEGSLQNIPEIPEDMKRIYVTAMDIKAEDHIRMQAAFQKHVDNSISKTCNFRFDATHDDVREGYLLAWKLGCKGLTVYRDGSREVQVLNLNKKKDTKIELPAQSKAEAATSPAQVAPVSEKREVQAPRFAAPVPPPVHRHEPVRASSGVSAQGAVAAAPVRERIAVEGVAEEHKAHETAREKIEAGICPECDTALQPAEGCTACPNCGWALCTL